MFTKHTTHDIIMNISYKLCKEPDMKEINNIGQRIKKLRENCGYTQKGLATKLNLKSETAIANYEAGYSVPKDSIKLKMCEIFNCSLDYLMCKSDLKTPLLFDSSTIAFITSINRLTPENQKIAKNIIEELLSSQDIKNKTDNL